MTTTYLTFNKELCDINSLVFPAEPVDVETELRHTWTVWVQTHDDAAKQAEYKDTTQSLMSFKTVQVYFFANFSIHKHCRTSGAHIWHARSLQSSFAGKKFDTMDEKWIQLCFFARECLRNGRTLRMQRVAIFSFTGNQQE